MKRTFILIVIAFVLTGSALAQEKQITYADFSVARDGAITSWLGGPVSVVGLQQNKHAMTVANPSSGNLPTVVREFMDAPQHIEYSYDVKAANGGVMLQVRARPEKDGAEQPVDVSAFQYIVIAADFRGTDKARIELVSKHNGIDLPDGSHPAAIVKVSPGMKKYVVPFASFQQPESAAVKVQTTAVLQKLTDVNIVVPGAPSKGTVRVQEIFFRKD